MVSSIYNLENTWSLADLFVSHHIQVCTQCRILQSQLSDAHRRKLCSQLSDEGLHLLIQVVQLILTYAILHLPYSDVAQARLVARCPLLTSRTSPQHIIWKEGVLIFRLRTRRRSRFRILSFVTIEIHRISLSLRNSNEISRADDNELQLTLLWRRQQQIFHS